MAALGDDPIVQRRRLRLVLRDLRLKSGQKQREIAAAMHWSLAKTMRIESGDVAISPNDLKALLDHYGVTDQPRVTSLVEMATASRGKAWSDVSDLYALADRTYMSLESAASIIRSFQNALVPGLVQTADYARAILTGSYGWSDEDAERGWQTREERQGLHDRAAPPEMFFILDEAVLHRVVGGSAVMRRQLEELKRWAGLSHVHIQVMPFSAGAFPDMRGPFILLEFAESEKDYLLYQEHMGAPATSREEPEVTLACLERFFDLEEGALSEEETIELLDEVIAEMKDGQKGEDS